MGVNRGDTFLMADRRMLQPDRLAIGFRKTGLTFASSDYTIGFMRWLPHGLRCAVIVAAAFVLAAGCNEDDTAFDEPTPEGNGALVVDNRTADSLSIFVGGVHTGRVAAASQTEVVLAPGLYRIVLDQDDGPRSFRDDVDVLLGRRTWLHVDDGATGSVAYAVMMEFE